MLTPDSSRFWPAAQWEPGRAQASYDKQFVRDWLTSPASGWDRSSGEAPPPLPEDVVARDPRPLRRGLRAAHRPDVRVTDLAAPRPPASACVFVYNADSGLLNTVRDIWVRVARPADYECALCLLTYGVRGWTSGGAGSPARWGCR